jgi:tRNA-(ms[2]io[6]A)-hydroxylase
MSDFLTPIYEFLGCVTPQAWIDAAITDIPRLLQDHANCEKKAASTAMNLLFRYNDKQQLQQQLTQLAREELLHYEQVMALMSKRGIGYHHVTNSRYAGSLRKHVRTYEPQHLVDVLIIGAFVEARSCERFAAIAPYLDAELKRFYLFLLKSEARHFEYYLSLAQLYSPEPIDERVAFFKEREAELILQTDSEVRFHSGVPC